MKILHTLIVVLCFSCVSVIAQNRISGMRSGKLSTDGEYARIRGINLIAMASGVWTEELEHAIKEHAPVLGNYINPLPGSSYHMTIHPLFTETSLPEFYRKKHARDWDAAWNNLMNSIAPYISELLPFVPGPLHPRFVRTFIGNGVTTLQLKLPHEEALNMSLFRRRIRDTIGNAMLNIFLKEVKGVEDRFQIREWYENNFVTPSIPSGADTYGYHLTLGYSRVLAERLSAEQINTMDQEKDMIDGVVRNLICPDYEKPGDICSFTLEKPFFGWFTSMVAMNQMVPGISRMGLPTVQMFNMTYPYSYGSYLAFSSRTLFQVILFFCVIALLVFIYKKVKHPGARSKRSLLLPITVAKSGPHEA